MSCHFDHPAHNSAFVEGTHGPERGSVLECVDLICMMCHWLLGGRGKNSLRWVTELAMATMVVKTLEGILHWAGFSKKRICAEKELLKLQLTAQQQTSPESPFVLCQANEHQAAGLILSLMESASCFSTKDRSHPGATIQTAQQKLTSSPRTRH